MERLPQETGSLLPQKRVRHAAARAGSRPAPSRRKHPAPTGSWTVKERESSEEPKPLRASSAGRADRRSRPAPGPPAGPQPPQRRGEPSSIHPAQEQGTRAPAPAAPATNGARPEGGAAALQGALRYPRAHPQEVGKQRNFQQNGRSRRGSRGRDTFLSAHHLNKFVLTAQIKGSQFAWVGQTAIS